MKKTLLAGTWCVAWLALGIAGCDEAPSCPSDDASTPDTGGADGDADGDGDSGADADVEPPLECTLPEIECDDGEHAEYSLCLDDDEEITISAGTFEMGAPSGTEFPAHTVSLNGFTIDRTEITNERYHSCVRAGCCTEPSYDGSYSGREPYYGNDDYDNFPVIFVTWNQARQYCEGLGKRLPTEAQWEFAARGDDGRPYPWGTEAPRSSLANFDNALDGDTSAVGTFDDGASPFGLEDMAGNVWEWVADWYSPSYYDESPVDDPTGPDDGVVRSARGGSFGSTAAELYSFYRANFLPTDTYSNVGFRCVR